VARASGSTGSPVQQQIQPGIVQALEDEHLAAREQRAVEGEAGIFGGGADQGDGAVLHHRQETILLGAVEAVDLVHEEQRGLAVGAAARGFLEAFLEVGDAGEHGAELDEVQVGLFGEQAGDGGLADARGAPEDQRGKRAALEHAREGAGGAQQVILADDLRQCAGAQAVRERTGGGRGLREWERQGHADNIAGQRRKVPIAMPERIMAAATIRGRSMPSPRKMAEPAMPTTGVARMPSAVVEAGSERLTMASAQKA